MNHNKNYDNDAEEKSRMNNFLENLKYIKEHNERFKEGKVSFELGLNKNCDLTDDEIAAINGVEKRVVPQSFWNTTIIM